MSAAEWWELAAVLLGFFSALVALIAPTPSWLARAGAAALGAAVACVAAGLLITFP